MRGGALPNLFVNIMGRGRAKAKYYGVGRAKQRKNGQFIKEKMTKIDFSMTFLWQMCSLIWKCLNAALHLLTFLRATRDTAGVLMYSAGWAGHPFLILSLAIQSEETFSTELWKTTQASFLFVEYFFMWTSFISMTSLWDLCISTSDAQNKKNWHFYTS